MPKKLTKKSITPKTIHQSAMEGKIPELEKRHNN
jgi:hypothetical protein